jgi:hypothetical protein
MGVYSFSHKREAASPHLYVSSHTLHPSQLLRSRVPRLLDGPDTLCCTSRAPRFACGKELISLVCRGETGFPLSWKVDRGGEGVFESISEHTMIPKH